LQSFPSSQREEYGGGGLRSDTVLKP
jgi:hypothetical protein